MRASYYIAGLLALATITNAIAIRQALSEIVVTSDGGGNYAAYSAKIDRTRASGERVVIDGPCNSACTLWLTLPHGQTCVTPRAIFGFHSAINSDTGFPNPRINEELLNGYPPQVRILILQQGGLWLNMIYIRGTRIAPRCK